MAYVNNIEGGGIVYADLGAPVAAGSVIVNAQSIVSAATTFPVNGVIDQSLQTIMGRFGRAVSIVASAAATDAITLNGRDYLGQPMRQTVTLNGTTPVVFTKAFRYVDSLTTTAGASVTVNVATIDSFGLPYKLVALVHERKAGITAANAGTFIAGLDNSVAATAANGDTRGTYTPLTVVPNGVVTLELRYIADEANLHGNAQWA